MAEQPECRLGAVVGAHCIVLLFPCVGDSYVLPQVQEPLLEMQRDKVYLPCLLFADAPARLSGTGGNHLMVSVDVSCHLSQEKQK